MAMISRWRRTRRCWISGFRFHRNPPLVLCQCRRRCRADDDEQSAPTATGKIVNLLIALWSTFKFTLTAVHCEVRQRCEPGRAKCTTNWRRIVGHISRNASKRSRSNCRSRPTRRRHQTYPYWARPSDTFKWVSRRTRTFMTQLMFHVFILVS